MRAKYVSLVVTVCSLSLRLRRSTAPIATNFTSAHTPPTNGTMAPSLLIAIRSELAPRDKRPRLRLLVLDLQDPLPDRKRLPTRRRRMHDHPQNPLQMLGDPPKRQFAPQAHQRLLCVRQQMPIRYLQFLIQGEKTRLHTAGRSHTRVPLLPAGLPASATSVVPVHVFAGPDRTARTPVPGWLHSRLPHSLAPLARSTGRADNSSAHRPLAQSRPASLSDALLSTEQRRRCSHGTWWINRPALPEPTWGGFSMIWQSRETFTSPSEPASECFCEHLHQTPCDFTLYPPLALAPLKRKSVPRGTRAPRALSIVGWFSQQPSLASVADSVAPDVCPLVLAAARALTRSAS